MSEASLEQSLERLAAPQSITVVGASPNGHITHHLVRNLKNPSCRFAGPIHLVNPRYERLFGLDCLSSVADIRDDPGLVYLLVSGESTESVLGGLKARPSGVVLFAEASHESGGFEFGAAHWGRQHGVAILGPQSNGLVSSAGGLNGLLIPMVEEIKTGHVALLAQSGGILGGLVKFLCQRGIGIHSAFEYGTAAMISPWQLGRWLLKKPEVQLLALYADGVDSIAEFSSLLDAARAAGKPLVLMVAGASAAARAATVSHSGMAATPRRILEGLAAQHRAVLASDLDELAWSVEVIAAAGFRGPVAGGVAVFSDSGGGAIAMAEALAIAGVPLAPPNPFDFGSASMGHAVEQADAIGAVAADEAFGTFAFASTIGTGQREQSVHFGQAHDFAESVSALGRQAFIASSLPFAEGAHGAPAGALYGNGSKESAVKLRALSQLGTPLVGNPAPLSTTLSDSTEVVSGDRAREELASLPIIIWPAQVTVDLDQELPEPMLRLPVVVKTEAGLAHRARSGGVLTGVSTAQELRLAVDYLRARFGGAVSVSEEVPHTIEYFLGAQRRDDATLILLGLGGAEAESAAVRVVPLDEEQARQFAIAQVPNHADDFVPLLLAFQTWLLERTWVRDVDLNPLVPAAAGGLIALDAKIHN